jgi:hypothetical protein
MWRVTLSVVATAVVAGCAPMTPAGPRDDRSRPTTFRTYDNAAEPEDPSCYHTGPCDKYELEFPQGQRIRIELWSSQIDTVLIVGDGAGERAYGTPESPAVIELGATAGPVRILAAASTSAGFGDYQLVVGPEPIAERSLPAPKLAWEARRDQLLSQHPIGPEFSIAEHEARRQLAAELDGLAQVPFDRAVTLHGFRPVDVPVDAGYCYRIAYTLQADASYSELALRGLSHSIETPDQRGLGSGSLTVLGLHAVTPRFCASTAGDARFTLVAEHAPRDHAAEVGTGAIDLRLYREPFWPGLRTKDDLARSIKEHTRGHSIATTFKVALASNARRAIDVTRGKCYTLVLRLADGAAWSASAIEHGIGMTYEGDHEDLSAGPGLVGPGAVSAIGCAQRSQRYQLSVVAYGPGDAVGTGSATAQLYVRSARRGELETLARDDAARTESDRVDAERRKRDHCAKCRKDHFGDQQAFESCAAQWYGRDACY